MAVFAGSETESPSRKKTETGNRAAGGAKRRLFAAG
jgi:hypothetical protein